MPFPSPMHRGKGSLSCVLRVVLLGIHGRSVGERKNLSLFSSYCRPWR